MIRFHKHAQFNNGYSLSIIAGQYISHGATAPFEVAVKNHLGAVVYSRFGDLDFRDGVIRGLSSIEVRSIINKLAKQFGER